MSEAEQPAQADTNTRVGRVLITGGAGFVGTNLVSRLVELDLADHIRVIDNESLGHRSALDGFDVEFLAGDIRDEDAMRGALDGMDAVVHLAAHTRVLESIEDPQGTFDNNVLATHQMLMLMRELNVPSIVNASTGGAIIGEIDPPVHEEMVPRPMSPYGASKLAIEGYLGAFAASYGIKAASLRFANVYGPLSFHKGSVVATYLRAVLQKQPLVVYGDGSQTRDYVYSADLCDGIVAAITRGAVGTYQLGSGKPTSINELISIIENTVGAERMPGVRYENFRDGEVRYTYCDVSKARRVLGYDPSTELPEGMQEAWAWFDARPVGANVN